MERSKISNEVREQLILSARQMRSAPTSSERKLWTYLRKRQIGGYKFRRQHVIHTFIVDFYCPTSRFVVEVDGDIHFGTKEYDGERDKLLESLGYRVLRIRNKQVEEEIGQVIGLIAEQLKEYQPIPTLPLERGRVAAAMQQPGWGQQAQVAAADAAAGLAHPNGLLLGRPGRRG